VVIRSIQISNLRGGNSKPLHTWDWGPMTITLQALSQVEKVELVQVRFTLCSRDQWSKWMQDGCKVTMDSYMTSNWSCFMVSWSIFKNHILEVGLTQKRETIHFEISLTLIYSILSCVWMGMWGLCVNRNSLKKHLVEGSVTYEFTQYTRGTCDRNTWFWKCHGTTFGHFF
jgi:hypothetical protein